VFLSTTLYPPTVGSIGRIFRNCWYIYLSLSCNFPVRAPSTHVFHPLAIGLIKRILRKYWLIYRYLSIQATSSSEFPSHYSYFFLFPCYWPDEKKFSKARAHRYKDHANPLSEFLSQCLYLSIPLLFFRSEEVFENMNSYMGYLSVIPNPSEILSYYSYLSYFPTIIPIRRIFWKHWPIYRYLSIIAISSEFLLTTHTSSILLLLAWSEVFESIGWDIDKASCTLWEFFPTTHTSSLFSVTLIKRIFESIHWCINIWVSWQSPLRGFFSELTFFLLFCHWLNQNKNSKNWLIYRYMSSVHTTNYTQLRRLIESIMTRILMLVNSRFWRNISNSEFGF